MKQRLFALFQSETEALGALNGLKSQGDLNGRYEAKLYTKPWETVGAQAVDIEEPGTLAVGRFALILGGVAGGGLALLFKGVLGIIHASLFTSVAVGVGMGAALAGLLGLWVGKIFPDRNLQKLSSRAIDGKVVLDVGVDDVETQGAVRKLLRKHHARKIALSEV